MTVAAVLLAAGAGSRFAGSDHKLTATLRGEPVLAHSLRTVLETGFNRVLVVAGAADLTAVVEEASVGYNTNVEILHNKNWSEGQATSLQMAIEALKDDPAVLAAVVGLGDQPDVGIAAWRTVGASHGSIVAATFNGLRRPPVKLDRSVWHLLPTEGDDGARVLMRDHPELVSEVPCAGDPNDVDTVEDLERIEAAHATRGLDR